VANSCGSPVGNISPRTEVKIQKSGPEVVLVGFMILELDLPQEEIWCLPGGQLDDRYASSDDTKDDTLEAFVKWPFQLVKIDEGWGSSVAIGWASIDDVADDPTRAVVKCPSWDFRMLYPEENSDVSVGYCKVSEGFRDFEINKSELEGIILGLISETDI
jgi:hypothetical protein